MVGDASLYINGAHGLGFNGKFKDSWYSADIIGYDRKVRKEEKTAYKDGSKELSKPFDNPSSTSWAWSMPYLIFQFA